MEMWLKSRIKKLSLLCWGTLWGTCVSEGQHSQQKGQISLSVWKVQIWPQMLAALEISWVGFSSHKDGLQQLFYKIECVWDQSWYTNLAGQLCIGYAGRLGVSPTCCTWLGTKPQEITVKFVKLYWQPSWLFCKISFFYIIRQKNIQISLQLPFHSEKKNLNFCGAIQLVHRWAGSGTLLNIADCGDSRAEGRTQHTATMVWGIFGYFFYSYSRSHYNSGNSHSPILSLCSCAVAPICFWAICSWYHGEV